MEDYANDIAWALDRLFEANMRVSTDKSFFFKETVEYIGRMVSSGGVTTSPYAVNAFQNYKQRNIFFSVRSFLPY